MTAVPKVLQPRVFRITADDPKEPAREVHVVWYSWDVIRAVTRILDPANGELRRIKEDETPVEGVVVKRDGTGALFEVFLLDRPHERSALQPLGEA